MHYCMGELVDWGFSHNENKDCSKCGMKESESNGCCEDKQKLLKIDTVHCVGMPDVFTNTSTNATTWSWNFGDGGTSAALNPGHTYASPGTYTVVFTNKLSNASGRGRFVVVK